MSDNAAKPNLLYILLWLTYPGSLVNENSALGFCLLTQGSLMPADEKDTDFDWYFQNENTGKRYLHVVGL